MAKKTRTKRSIYSPYKEEVKELLNKGYSQSDIYKILRNKYNINSHYSTLRFFIKTRLNKKINIEYEINNYEL